jgi:hypothetical protein
LAHTARRRPARRSCPLRRPGDCRCSGPAEVEITDAYGAPLWGCIRHAAAALRLVDRSHITATTRNSAIRETRAAAGDRP